MKRLLLALAILGLGTLALSQSTTLTAVRASDLSLDAGAAYWTDAPTLEVQMVAAQEGDADGPVVMLQAVYDNDSIAIRAEWADATESVMKNAWTWDGTAFTKSGDEDRIMFAWPIGNNPDFASKGCTAACHNEGDDTSTWWMGSDSDDVRFDAWQWKAARTNPVGYIDDKWWGTLTDPEDVESSRHGDSREGGSYANNRNEEQTGPTFMSSEGTAARFIVDGQQIELDTSTLAVGDVIPGYILAAAVGSRGDIATRGVWTDGKWVVVLMRPLDTGHDDDTVFRVRRRTPFGLSVVDDGGGLSHTVGEEVLVLDWK
ncbi:MAG: hypothetical protein JSV66_09010 [Trueperaceae bacterium]|nr:MAG: hypothetical protein JSV66_09010 [Trueperaceae bacterium]